MTNYRRRPRRRKRSRNRSRSVSAEASVLLPLLGASGLVLLMFIVSAATAPGLGVIDQPLWQLQQAAVFWRTLASVLLTLTVICLGFVGLGLLLMRSLLNASSPLSGAFCLTLLAVSGVTVLCALLKDHWLPSAWPLYLAVSLPSAAFGALMATLLARTARPVLSFIVLAAATGMFGVMVVTALATLLLQPSPLGVTDTTLTSVDRVRLTRLLRAGSPRHMAPAEVKTLKLAATDLNQLATWGLSLGSANRKFSVSMNNSSVEAAASLQWAPRLLSEPVYLNLLGNASPTVIDGALAPGIRVANVGSLRIPAFLANWLATGLYDLAAADPRFAGALLQLHDVRIDNSQLVATYGAMTMPDGLRADVFGALGDPDVVAVAFSQHLHLQKLFAATASAGDVSQNEALASLVAETFAIASQRYQQLSTDPILENRLAIIALGLVLGHPKIAEVVPQLPPGFNAAPRLWRQAPLRGRSDWTRHFWVAAALTMLSDEALSIDLSYLKEELDAGTPGGSGFSFADLGADLAGVAFAQAVTSSHATAVTMQRKLARRTAFNEFVPTLQDLPEGLSEQVLRAEYGGSQGPKYLQLVETIQARIAASPAYARPR